MINRCVLEVANDEFAVSRLAYDLGDLVGGGYGEGGAEDQTEVSLFGVVMSAMYRLCWERFAEVNDGVVEGAGAEGASLGECQIQDHERYVFGYAPAFRVERMGPGSNSGGQLNRARILCQEKKKVEDF